MASLWHRTVFGKLVDPATDCIVPGTEYARTGVGRAFPASALSACTPQAIGVSDRIDWTGYPWRLRQAQFTLRPVRAPDGVSFLQAARLLVRREQRDTGGRYFHQTAYAVVPLDDLADDLDLFALPAALTSVPLAARSTDLEPLRVAGGDVPLPGGWLDTDTLTMLAAVLAGVGASYQSRELAPDEFVALALRCLACLPRAVRWRVSLGGGFPEPPDGYALVHGAGAASPGRIRRLAGSWRLTEGPPLEPVEGLARRVEAAVARARSITELLRLADEFWGPELLNRCPDGLPAEADWVEAAEVLRERAALPALRAYLAAPHGPSPPLMQFRRERSRVLAEIVPAVLAGTAPLSMLRDAWGADWAPAWEAVASGTGATATGAAVLAGLHGVLTFDLGAGDPDALDRALQLVPEADALTVAQRLVQAWNRTAPADRIRWSALVRAAGRDRAPPVLRAWRDQHPGELLWAGIELETRPGGPRCVSDWMTPAPGLVAYRALRDGRAPALDEFRELLQTITPALAPLTERFVALARTHGLVAEAVLLSAADGPTPFVATDRQRDAAGLVDGVVRYGPEPPLVGALLELWAELPAAREAVLAPIIGPHLEVRHQRILFGDAPIPAAPAVSERRPALRALADAAVPRLVARSDQHRRRASALDAPVRTIEVRRTNLAEPDPGDDTIAERFVREVIEVRCRELPDLSGPQARAALRRFERVAPSSARGLPPGGITTPGRARAAAAIGSRALRFEWEHAEADRFVPELLAEPDPEFFDRAAAAAEMTNVPVFRFLTSAVLDQPRGGEERALLALPDDTFAAVVRRFVRLSGPLVGRLLVLLGTGFAFDPPYLRALVGTNTARRLMADAVYRNLLGRLPRDARAEVVGALHNARGLLRTHQAVGNDALQQLALDLLQGTVGEADKAARTEWTRSLTADPDTPCPPQSWAALADWPPTRGQNS
jgi:hypothetical protein